MYIFSQIKKIRKLLFLFISLAGGGVEVYMQAPFNRVDMENL